jgi:hypothetical protein
LSGTEERGVPPAADRAMLADLAADFLPPIFHPHSFEPADCEFAFPSGTPATLEACRSFVTILQRIRCGDPEIGEVNHVADWRRGDLRCRRRI